MSVPPHVTPNDGWASLDSVNTSVFSCHQWENKLLCDSSDGPGVEVCKGQGSILVKGSGKDGVGKESRSQPLTTPDLESPKRSQLPTSPWREAANRPASVSASVKWDQ